MTNSCSSSRTVRTGHGAFLSTHAFATLEPELRSQIYRHLWNTLNADGSSDEFKHLNNDVRIAIREIITDTKTDLPAYWHAHPEASVSR